MAHIVIVEDDASVRELIRCTLSSAGFETEAYESAESFLEGFESREKSPQLLLLDIMLPGMDGTELFRRLKNAGAEIPAIFLTAKNTEIDKVTGLEMGADDYIAKPFGVLELIARVKAVLRRAVKDTDHLCAGLVRLDVAGRSVRVGEEKVALTYKEFEMLRCFMQNKGIVLTRDKLLNEIWGVEADIETRTVDMHVKTLRKKIGPAGGYIKTVRGVGYEFEV